MMTSLLEVPVGSRRPAAAAAGNRLLACLPRATRRIWDEQLDLVDLAKGEVIHETSGRLSFVYFPLTAIVAQLYLLDDGASAESALVGNEGMVGFPLVLGGDATPSRAVVLVAGEAWRVRAGFLHDEVRHVTPVMHLLLRYLQAMMTQITQTAVCNRHHPTDQQLCRWLLLVTDRLPAGEFAMTQELMAVMLGVRRESVTEAAGKLQRTGVIRYARGQVTVLDRAALERQVCACYPVVQREYLRLLPARMAT